MKVILNSGEHIVVVVPSRTESTASISIETDFGTKVSDISTESGLIENATEHVARRRDVAKTKEDKLQLWAHIVSKHAAIVSPMATLRELQNYHNDEHEGPGTIRNHDPSSREFSIHRLGEVLIESEPEDGQ